MKYESLYQSSRVDIESMVDFLRFGHKASLYFEWNTNLSISTNWSNSLETDVLRVICCVFKQTMGHGIIFKNDMKYIWRALQGSFCELARPMREGIK